MAHTLEVKHLSGGLIEHAQATSPNAKSKISVFVVSGRIVGIEPAHIEEQVTTNR